MSTPSNPIGNKPAEIPVSYFGKCPEGYEKFSDIRVVNSMAIPTSICRETREHMEAIAARTIPNAPRKR